LPRTYPDRTCEELKNIFAKQLLIYRITARCFDSAGNLNHLLF